MDASRKPSIASEVHASHERPHRLALLATSPVATGEAKQEEPRKGTETPINPRENQLSARISKPYPRKGTERTSSLPCQSGGGGPRKRWRGRHGRKP